MQSSVLRTLASRKLEYGSIQLTWAPLWMTTSTTLTRRSQVLCVRPRFGFEMSPTTGYGQSKWASEFIVREAGRRGLVGAVVRPGYITGDPASGISVTDDFLVRLWKGCLQVRARPDIANTLNAVPVTQVSRIVVAAAFHLDAALEQPLGVAQV